MELSEIPAGASYICVQATAALGFTMTVQVVNVAEIVNESLFAPESDIKDGNARWFSLVTPTESGYQVCSAFDHATRRCTIYETRPYVCSGYPYDRPCAFCTYDGKTTGTRYAPIEETGIFAHSEQPTLEEARRAGIRP